MIKQILGAYEKVFNRSKESLHTLNEQTWKLNERLKELKDKKDGSQLEIRLLTLTYEHSIEATDALLECMNQINKAENKIKVM